MAFVYLFYTNRESVCFARSCIIKMIVFQLLMHPSIIHSQQLIVRMMLQVFVYMKHPVDNTSS